MILNRLKVTGFMRWRYPTEFIFDDGQNLMVADNKQGKTSLAAAVAYVLTGRYLDGSDRVDALINEHCRAMEVETDLTIAGRKNTVIRGRDVSKKTAVTKLFLNGEPAKAADIFNLIGDEKQFLAAWWPFYLLYLEEEDASKLLRGLIKPVTEQEALAALTADQRKLLEGLRLLDAAQVQKDLRRQITDNEAAVERLKGNIEVYNQTLAAPVPDAMPRLGEQITQTEKAIADLTAGEKPTDVAPFQTEVANLKAEYDRVKAGMQQQQPAPEPGKCPTCGQTMTDFAFAQVAKKHQDAAAAIEAANGRRRSRLQEVVEQAKQVKARVAEIEAANANLPDPEFVHAEELAKLRADLADLKRRDQEAERTNAQHDAMTTAQEDAKKNKAAALAKIKATNDEIPQIKAQVAAVGDYVAAKERLAIEQLSQYLNRTGITLSKVVKETGEIKPDFAITYDDQKLKTMAQSDETRAGLEFSAMINAITGREYPVYIDGGESVNDYTEPAGQFFVARVAPPGTPLHVNGVEIKPVDEAQAEPAAEPQAPASPAAGRKMTAEEGKKVFDVLVGGLHGDPVPAPALREARAIVAEQAAAGTAVEEIISPHGESPDSEPGVARRPHSALYEENGFFTKQYNKELKKWERLAVPEPSNPKPAAPASQETQSALDLPEFPDDDAPAVGPYGPQLPTPPADDGRHPGETASEYHERRRKELGLTLKQYNDMMRKRAGA